MDDAPKKNSLVRLPNTLDRLAIRKEFRFSQAKRPAKYAVKELMDGGWAVIETVLLFATEQEAEIEVRKLLEKP